MNSAIETWRVEQFGANVLHLSQQKGSRFAPVVRKEVFKGKAEFFDRLAAGTAQLKTSRNADTPNLDLTHSRRMVTTRMYEWATLVDRKDKLQNIHSPESEYAMAARNALGRAMDDVIITALGASASVGEDGTTAASADDGYFADDYIVASVASSAIDELNVQALRKAALIMNEREAEGQRFIVCRAKDIENLLQQTEVTSSDYNTVKALVRGEIDSFLGFKFIRSERLLVPSATYVNQDGFSFNTSTGLFDAGGTAIADSYSSYKCAFAFTGDSMILGMNEGLVARVDERKDKSYNMQVYASMDFGAVRMEEAKVVPIIVKA